MFRLITHRSLPVCFSLTLLICGITSSILYGQQKAAPAENNQQPKVSKELWQLLTDWSNASSRVKKLHGKHERHAYDPTFGIEKVSTGQFWYEAPDKGRIDVNPVKITPRMIADRQKPDAQVERKNGKPFKLQSDDQERWICDGTKIYDIDDQQKTARVVHLPPQLRGQNIMNTPLPFLFGLPPEKAVQRFNMTIVQDYRPKYNVVLLEATPRTRQDAENWSQARIFLDTELFLPTAVKLVSPAKTNFSVYKFRDMQVNKNGIIEKLLGKDPWNPKLTRDYQIHTIQPGQQQANQQQPVPQNGPVIPDVVGQNHVAATKLLVEAGIPEKIITRLNAGPAPRTDLTYRVRAQDPMPNTPIKKVQKVVLKIYDKAQTGANAARPAPVRVAKTR